ncbi:TlpA family protein disulfide reductase [Telmatospirillum siberiense]|uniref:TlpA family protein disulfide reductase n=2 Tax=Telmatospirillum siberiense TaxID=382514 RepID=A0A2N3Q1Y7_9PROT|nr:TlpA family protein disulfide reductase [Telmatospirillum siberiense]
MGHSAHAGELLLSSAPKLVPSVTFTDQDGRPLGLEAFKGKVVVLDYWATWCAPCRAEFPQLDKLQGRLADKGLVVVAVSLDRKGKPVVDRFYEDLRISHLGKYLDPSSHSATALGIRGLPTTLLIDRQGREVVRVEGEAAWDGPEIGKILEGLLAGG